MNFVSFLVSFIALIVFFGFSASYSFASTGALTPWLPVYHFHGLNQEQTDQISTIDGVYLPSLNSSGTLGYKIPHPYDDFGIATSSAIYKMEVKYVASGHDMTVWVAGVTTYTESECLADNSPLPVRGMGEYIAEVTTGLCNDFLNDDLFREHSTWMRNTSYIGNQNWQYDGIEVRFDYFKDIFNFNIDNAVADIDNNVVRLDLSGDLPQEYENINYCQISVIEKATEDLSGAGNRALWGGSLNDIVAYIQLHNDENLTSTQYLGGITYKGYGFYPPESFDWYAKGVEVPYRENWQMEYLYDYYCVDENNNLVVEGQNHDNTVPTYETDNTATTSAGLTGDANAQCGVLEIACVVFNRFTNWFRALVTPNLDTIMPQVDYFTAQWRTKVPFGYIYAIQEFAFNPPPSSSEAPDINIPLVNASGEVVNHYSDVPSFVDNALSTIRTFIKMCIWLMFVVYLLFLARRVIPGGWH